MADDGDSWPTRRGLTVDVVLFTKVNGALSVLMVERGKEPFRSTLALPGGFVESGERALDAAVRELAEETGVGVPARCLRRFGSYGRPGRDPRGQVTSVAFHGYVAGAPEVSGGDDASAARWVALADFLSSELDVAFDHRDIVRDAVIRRFGWRCRTSAQADAASPDAADPPARGGREPPAGRRGEWSVLRSGPGSPRRW